MKVVILAGGLGTRLSEETIVKPKPLIEIGERPIIWHIMKLYSYYGFNDFIICCGYKGYLIKEYFCNYSYHASDLEVDLSKNQIKIINKPTEPWKIALIDTGNISQTGGRLLKIKDLIDDGDTFHMTYGDGVSNVNIKALTDFHYNNGQLATVTAVQPPGRFGALELDKNKVRGFVEKPSGDGGWINGGFFVLKKDVINYVDSFSTVWEQKPLKSLAKENEINAYFHKGFWYPMDTLRDKSYLEEQWKTNPQWKVW